MKIIAKSALLISTAILASVATYSQGADKAAASGEYTLVIKDHKFSPDKLTVPAGKEIKITVDNQDAEPEEFDSSDLSREKIIKGNSKGVVIVGPLKPGNYEFFGEFHAETAQGMLTAQ